MGKKKINALFILETTKHHKDKSPFLGGWDRRRESEEQEREGKLMHLLDLLNTSHFSSNILPEIHKKGQIQT